MKDFDSIVSVAQILPPAALDADNTPAAIDLMGAMGVEVLIEVGAGGITFDTTNKVEFKLTHSDDNSSYAAVTTDDLVGAPSVGSGGVIYSLVAAHAAGTVHQFGYIGGKRYLKLLADFSGTHGTATPMAAQVVKYLTHRG